MICEYVRITNRRRTAVQMLAASNCVTPFRRVALSNLTFGSLFSSTRVGLFLLFIFVARNAVSAVLVSARLKRTVHLWRPWKAFDLPDQLSALCDDLHTAARPLPQNSSWRDGSRHESDSVLSRLRGRTGQGKAAMEW